MDLKYVLITILKILISTPALILMQHTTKADSSAMMGGHMDNKNSSTSLSESLYDEYDLQDSRESTSSEEIRNRPSSQNTTDSEEIPDPSPLVLPGYNLPENIFNHGKPFYVEKDPLTGKINFEHKSPTLKLDDIHDYVEDVSNDNIYQKSNIDRKDGSISHSGSHRPSDINQLTPNFHDFLNLPIKYNSDKYVYPLISSSYASTKIQGSVNKFHNHKDYNVKTTTKKTTVSPKYYSPPSTYFNPKSSSVATSTTTTTSTGKPLTTRTYPEIFLTTKAPSVMDTGMPHPTFIQEYEYYDNSAESSTDLPKITKNNYLTTENINNIYLTSKAPTMTTTKRTLSLFEQLFGDYDETVTITEKTNAPPLFDNPPSSKTKYNIVTTENQISSTTTAKPSSTNQYPNAHAGPNNNVLTGTSMGLDASYEYEDYDNERPQDNIAVEDTQVKKMDILKVEPLKPNKNKSEVFNMNESVVQDNKPSSTKYGYGHKDNTATTTSTTISTTTTKLVTSTASSTTATRVKVTSLPLGENHINTPSISRDPIIVATQNLREKLNGEKVPNTTPQKPPQLVPSTSNVHIAHDQDVVSFVVGNHQSVDGGEYVGTALKESPYDSNPFRPLYAQQETHSNSNSVKYTLTNSAEAIKTSMQKPIQFPEIAGSAVTIQPLKNSEASLAIGVPINGVKRVPGQVVDEKLEIKNEQIEFPKGNGHKVVFPNQKEPDMPDLVPPPPQDPQSNREVLKLNSKPMYHQLPSDLTPPREKEIVPLQPRPARPPWDPRPGHFYSGKPEYARPPRPPLDVAYKRIDNLPNILPQFRPNMKHHHPHQHPHFYDHRLNRQPLLERPSNRPVGFFEKLHPPPPPLPPFHAHKNLHNLKKMPQQPPQRLDDNLPPQPAEDRIINEGPVRPQDHSKPPDVQEYGFYQTPPNIKIANRRHSDDDDEVETLQMIQAKNAEKPDLDEYEEEPVVAPIKSSASQTVRIPAEASIKSNTEKTIYKVYPVNTPPIKLDAIDSNKKETVVIGTLAELPLPPSKINKDFVYDHKDRNDAPILKPHPRPLTYPIKSDFPYPLERPDPSVIHPAVPESPSENKLEDLPLKFEETSFTSNNQWNTINENIESRIVNGQKFSSNSNQISVTLKTYTEKPIAVAYTPTEPNLNADKYSMPNYGSPVIPEIRPGTVENAETGYGANSANEYTVGKVHTNPNVGLPHAHRHNHLNDRPSSHEFNHKIDTGVQEVMPEEQDFQAPFQASVNIDSTINQQGWSIVRDKNKTTTEGLEVTTIPLATTSEFDIENFKPQLIGGFKPIYDFPNEDSKKLHISEREE